jgi:AcrR family transcriptional regulator
MKGIRPLHLISRIIIDAASFMIDGNAAPPHAIRRQGAIMTTNPSNATKSVPEGRLTKKRRVTRARLLQSAYEIMSETGVDDAKLKDITDRADVGFGTFYNYFPTKDALANEALDCVIHDLGRRNSLATQAMANQAPALIMPISIRLMMRAIIGSTMWRWWAMRPDLLADRICRGFGPFGMRDMRTGAASGLFSLEESEIAPTWAMAVWVMVGGIHAILVHDSLPESESFVAQTVMRMMGVPIETARALSTTQLPDYPLPSIDWTFRLDTDPAA